MPDRFHAKTDTVAHSSYESAHCCTKFEIRMFTADWTRIASGGVDFVMELNKQNTRYFKILWHQCAFNWIIFTSCKLHS